MILSLLNTDIRNDINAADMDSLCCKMENVTYPCSQVQMGPKALNEIFTFVLNY